jgi:undecaprenyl-diphosphatase
MKNNVRKNIIISALLLILFAAFTLAMLTVNVAPTGPAGSVVGLSAINGAVFSALGVSDIWYNVTEILGFLAIGVAFAFALLGLYQLIKRKSILKVDGDILLLAALYVLVAVFYVLFEIFTVNCRPILVDGVLEASYPSSHTMLFCTVIGSAPILLRRKLREKKALLIAADVAATVLSLIMAVGRLLSGMHWLTDIIAGILLSALLISLYVTALSVYDKKQFENS